MSKYPGRFGKLAGMFLNLLDEAKLTEDRVTYWKNRLRAIDTDIAPGHNGPQFEQTDNGKQNATRKGATMK